jgi:non-ribosomal peptide synthetase component F
MILTAEVYPTRIHGVGNGFSWSIAWLFGFVLWPFLAVGLQQHTGSFAAAFLLIPAAMACMALGVWWFTPDHAGQDLDQIAT